MINCLRVLLLLSGLAWGLVACTQEAQVPDDLLATLVPVETAVSSLPSSITSVPPPQIVESTAVPPTLIIIDSSPTPQETAVFTPTSIPAEPTVVPTTAPPVATATQPIGEVCSADYFFTPAPQRCPTGPATILQAAEQRFEQGRMIWLASAPATIIVFFDDGTYQQFPDTWTEADPVSDPLLLPPEGGNQPIRGFGKVWRDQPGVWDRLGWAVAAEQGYETHWQVEQPNGGASAPVYLRTLAGQVLQYGTLASGSWRTVTP